jgi:L-alanine-DL-glutamate epimerase-like enolase superfamily enzyme
MKIIGFDATRVRIPNKQVYKMSLGAHESLQSVLVRVYTDGGIVGVGEAHQGVPSYTPETIDTMHAVITNVYGPCLIGRELEGLEALHAALTAVRKGNNFARCAVEMALFDALARSWGRSICEVLGGPVRRQMQLAIVMGIDEPEALAAKAADLVKSGYRTIKVKIGTRDIQNDLSCVRAVRKSVGDEIAIRVDANAGYELSDALVIARGLADLGLEHLEQPVRRDDVSGMACLRQLGAVNLLADESVETPEDAHRLILAGAADAIKIKVSKVGGYINARKIIDIAEAAGVRIIIGQGICSSLEAAGEVQLACAYPHVYEVGEMTGPSKLKGDLTNVPIDVGGGSVDLPKGPGLGVELSEENLLRFGIGPDGKTANEGSQHTKRK